MLGIGRTGKSRPPGRMTPAVKVFAGRRLQCVFLVLGLGGCQEPDATNLVDPEAILERLQTEDRMNAILALAPDVENQLRALPSGPDRGPLHGLSVLVKDNIHVRGMPTTAGSKALLGNMAETDAPVIANLRRTGAIVVGKTNLSEWANFRSTSSTSGWSSVGGLTTNPHDSSCSACGSSSGSGAAVGGGLVQAAIGTETDGSITCPAAMCGIVGLKPTVGLLSTEGIIPIAASQDTAGPMTRDVRLAARMLSAMAGEGSQDYEAALRADALDGVRLGVLLPLCDRYGETVAATFTEARRILESAGATLVEITEIPEMRRISQLEWALLLREFKRDLNLYLAATPPAVKTRTLAELIAFNEAHASEVMPYFGQEIFEQSEATMGGEDPNLPAMAAEARNLAGPEGIDRLLAAYDCEALIAPTTGRAFPISLQDGDSFQGAATTLPAVSGYPHLTVPMGEAGSLPVGLSLMGPARSEAELLALGYAFEQARGD